TSGLSSAAISRASTPFRANPTTSMCGLRESISLTTFLTKAESSTMRVRISMMASDPNIPQSVADFLQFKIRSQSQQGFRGAHKQMRSGRHFGGHHRHRLPDRMPREVNENVPA